VPRGRDRGVEHRVGDGLVGGEGQGAKVLDVKPDEIEDLEQVGGAVDSDHGEQAWIDANAARVSEALNSPEAQEALYRLLGGEPDRSGRGKPWPARVARLRLKWRPGS
jgi:hypothetical protein